MPVDETHRDAKAPQRIHVRCEALAEHALKVPELNYRDPTVIARNLRSS
jgi:hypothetical protein